MFFPEVIIKKEQPLLLSLQKQKRSGIPRERESMNIVFYTEKLATLPAHLHWTYYYHLCEWLQLLLIILNLTFFKIDFKVSSNFSVQTISLVNLYSNIY